MAIHSLLAASDLDRLRIRLNFVRLKEGNLFTVTFKPIAFFMTVSFGLQSKHILPVTTFAVSVNYLCVEIGNYTLL